MNLRIRWEHGHHAFPHIHNTLGMWRPHGTLMLRRLRMLSIVPIRKLLRHFSFSLPHASLPGRCSPMISYCGLLFCVVLRCSTKEKIVHTRPAVVLVTYCSAQTKKQILLWSLIWFYCCSCCCCIYSCFEFLHILIRQREKRFPSIWLTKLEYARPNLGVIFSRNWLFSFYRPVAFECIQTNYMKFHINGHFPLS